MALKVDNLLACHIQRRLLTFLGLDRVWITLNFDSCFRANVTEKHVPSRNCSTRKARKTLFMFMFYPLTAKN